MERTLEVVDVFLRVAFTFCGVSDCQIAVSFMPFEEFKACLRLAEGHEVNFKKSRKRLTLFQQFLLSDSKKKALFGVQKHANP